MNGIRRGDLYWIDADALRPSVPGVPHPWVVVQNDVLNASRIPTVVVCGLTSRVDRATEPGTVLLQEGSGGLTKPSVVLASQICVVDKEALGTHVGTLEERDMRRVMQALRFLVRLQRT